MRSIEQPAPGRAAPHVSRGRITPRTALANPVPTALVAIGLAWLAGAERRAGGGAVPANADREATPGRAEPAAADSRPGRNAASPTKMPARGWWQVLMRVKDQTSEDNMSIIAAGCAFFALLALFPAITALVSLYGLIADPTTIEHQLESIRQVVPQEAFGIIQGQAHAVASSGGTVLGWGAALAIVLALYSASSGIKTLFTALDIAYEEEETRGFIRFNVTALLFTLAGIVGIAIGLAVIVGVPAVLAYVPLGPLADWTVRIVSWLVLLALVVGGLSIVYRYGPARATAQWRWLTPGAIAAAILWLIASVAFSFYAAHFGGYNQTYGTLGGVIILLMWLWISAFVILLGAELNAELELQTDHDTTTGQPLAMGQRDAYAADHTPASRAADPATS